MIKRFSLVFAVLIAFGAAANAATESDASSCEEYQRIDKDLNRIYNKVLAEYSLDEVFIKKFIASQAAWENYRDSYVESLYPDANDKSSTLEQCRCAEKSELAKDRIDQIIVWLEGADPEEPAECVGSVKAFAEPRFVLTLEDFGYCWVTTHALPVFATKSTKSKTLVQANQGDVIEILEIDDENQNGIWLKVRTTGEIRLGYDKGQKPRKNVTGWIYGTLKEILKCK